MLIAVDVEIPFPCPLVYVTYRDQLEKLVKYMDSVDRVEVKSRRQEKGRVNCINEWHSNAQIPAPVRAVVGENLFSWTESEIWNESDLTVRWQIQSHTFTEAVASSGEDRFRAEGNKTLVEHRVELRINPQKLSSIPWFLRSQIAELSEKFLAQQIVGSLKQMGEGVRQELSKTVKMGRVQSKVVAAPERRSPKSSN